MFLGSVVTFFFLVLLEISNPIICRNFPLRSRIDTLYVERESKVSVGKIIFARRGWAKSERDTTRVFFSPSLFVSFITTFSIDLKIEITVTRSSNLDSLRTCYGNNKQLCKTIFFNLDRNLLLFVWKIIEIQKNPLEPRFFFHQF